MIPRVSAFGVVAIVLVAGAGAQPETKPATPPSTPPAHQPEKQPEKQPDKQPDKQPANAPGAPFVPAPLLEPVVQVVNAGAADGRRELRIKPVAGTTQTLKMTATQTSEMTLPGRPPRASATPGRILTMVITTDKVEASGEVRFTTVYRDLKVATERDVSAKQLESAKALSLKLEGLRTTSVMNDRGVVTSSVGELSGADNELKQAIDNIVQSMAHAVVPCPKEAIGVGGTWKATTKMAAMGLMVDMVSEYTVKEWTPTGALLDVVITQSVKDQEIKGPGIAGNAATMQSMNAEIKGSILFDSASIMPKWIKNKSKVKTKMLVKSKGQAAIIEGSSDGETNIEETTAKPAPTPTPTPAPASAPATTPAVAPANEPAKEPK